MLHGDHVGHNGLQGPAPLPRSCKGDVPVPRPRRKYKNVTCPCIACMSQLDEAHLVGEVMADRKAATKTCACTSRRPPLLPAAFVKEMDSCTFMDKEDRVFLQVRPICGFASVQSDILESWANVGLCMLACLSCKMPSNYCTVWRSQDLYKTSFNELYCKAHELDFAGLGWTDTELDLLLDALQTGAFTNLRLVCALHFIALHCTPWVELRLSYPMRASCGAIILICVHAVSIYLVRSCISSEMRSQITGWICLRGESGLVKSRNHALCFARATQVAQQGSSMRQNKEHGIPRPDLAGDKTRGRPKHLPATPEIAVLRSGVADLPAATLCYPRDLQGLVHLKAHLKTPQRCCGDDLACWRGRHLLSLPTPRLVTLTQQNRAAVGARLSKRLCHPPPS